MKRDFSLRRPTHSQDRMRKKNSTCSVRNDGVVGRRGSSVFRSQKRGEKGLSKDRRYKRKGEEADMKAGAYKNNVASFEYPGTGMLRLRQEIRCFSGAAPVHLREAALGAIQPEARRGHAHVGKPEEPAAHAVALRRSIAERSAGLTGRRRDAAGARAASGRGHFLQGFNHEGGRDREAVGFRQRGIYGERQGGLAAPLRERRGIESYRLL